MTTRRQLIAPFAVSLETRTLSTRAVFLFGQAMPRWKSLGDLWLEFAALRLPHIVAKVAQDGDIIGDNDYTYTYGGPHTNEQVLRGTNYWTVWFVVADDVHPVTEKEIRRALELEIASDTPTNYSDEDMDWRKGKWVSFADMRKGRYLTI
jgi:hypothetical protein